ncbi:MAG: pyridoxamine 5'-phosphate oxidase family protein [Chromatiales bacterium]|nr:MAG: pyridoxamine 5'-phosphate oxidase family protein [Chromatiales bacterium]
MTAHSWLHETPWPTKQLPRAELSERIEHLLATHWMGVLSTVGKGGPIGSPVEYYADAKTIYILPQPGSPKLQALQQDPRVCFSIYAENSGWASVRGAQLFGNAQLLDPGTSEHVHAMTIYRWQSSALQLGKPLDEPPQMQLLKIDPERVVYTEQWLRKGGFGPRQIWHKDASKAAAARRYGH